MCRFMVKIWTMKQVNYCSDASRWKAALKIGGASQAQTRHEETLKTISQKVLFFGFILDNEKSNFPGQNQLHGLAWYSITEMIQ